MSGRGRLVLLAATALLAAGCSDGLLVTPADPTPVDLALTLAPSAAVQGTSADAFGKTDAAVVHLTSGSSAVLDTAVAVAGNGDRTVTLRVRLPRSPLALGINLDLNATGHTLFKGSGSAQLARGRRTEAVVTLVPVVAGVVSPDTLPTLTALGDTARARGAAIFATGDTVPGVQLSWADGGSAVVRAQPDGSYRALTEGTVTLTGSYQGFTTKSVVVVRAIVVTLGFTLGVDTTTIDLGTTKQLTAIPKDRNGNILTRTPTWQSANPGIATVDAKGNVRGVAPGVTTITATVEGKTATIRVTVRARIVVRPVDTTLISGDSVILVVGDSATFRAKAFDPQGNEVKNVTFSYSSSDPRTVYINPVTGLAESYAEGGVYVVAHAGLDSGYVRVRVNHPVVGLALTKVTLGATIGGSSGAQTISVINAGSGPLTGLTATVQYPVLGTPGWLTATLSGGTPPATLTLTANAAGLPAGTYTATVVVSSTTRGAVPGIVTVTLTVSAPTGGGGGVISIPPSSGLFQATTAHVAYSY